MSDLTNTDLGQYHLQEVIRHGGMATVYKAHQASLDRYVAVKVLANSPDPQFAVRFKREARAIAQLQHPNILPVYDYGEQDGALYLVVQYIENGTTLGDLLSTPLEPVAALRLGARVLSALDYAHQRGIIHRDIKPSNVLMPSPTWPLLADFGIAKILNAGDGHALTMSGVFIGTPAYVAPEQVFGATIDVRTDLYAMGVVLYEMLTGRVPFDAETPMSMLTKHAYEPPPAPRTINPHLPPVVEPMLLRALAKDPSDRYQTASLMAEALERLALQIEQGHARDQHAALYESGLRAFEEGRWDVAVERLRELVAVAPGYEDAADLLVAAQEAQVKTKTEARQQLERVQQRRQSVQQAALRPTLPPPPVPEPAPQTEPRSLVELPAASSPPAEAARLGPAEAGGQPVAGAAPPPAIPVTVAAGSRNRTWLAALALAVLVLVGGAAWGLSGALTPGGSPTATPATGVPGIGDTADATALGTLQFDDNTATLDEVTLAVDRLPLPATGMQYEAWLLGQGGEQRQSLSVLKLDANGHGELVYHDRLGQNLLQQFDRLEITAEPNPDANPGPSGQVVFAGSLPPQALEHVRHLLVSYADTPNKIGLTVGLLQQTALLDTTAQELLAAQQAGDLVKMKRAAEGMVNLIAGPTGQSAGDLDGDGTVTNPGDGFGLLLNGNNSGYIEGTLAHNKLAAAQPDANANIKLHAVHVQIAAQNLSEWAVQLRDITARIATSKDTTAAGDDVRLALALADRMRNGKDLNGNEVIDPLPGEAGAKTAYQHARYLADIPVIPLNKGGTPPAGAATSLATPAGMAMTMPPGAPPSATRAPPPPPDTPAPSVTSPPPPPPTATPPPAPPTATLVPPSATPIPVPPTATSAPPPPTATPNLVPIGLVAFRDGDHQQPVAQITGTLQLPPSPTGQAFYGWLVNSTTGASLSLGRLTDLNFKFADPGNANLLAAYDAFVVTAEALEIVPSAPSAAVAFRGQLPPLALVHIRHLLVSFPATPDKIGLAVGLYAQVGVLYQHTEALNKAYGVHDLALLRAEAEQIVNLIEGTQGTNFGDLDKDGTVKNAGDGYGLLPNGNQLGYLRGTRDHAALAAAAADATAAIKQHAANVAVTVDNMQGWATTLRDRALAITQAADLKTTIPLLRDIMSLAYNIYYGVGLQADSQPQPVPGSGGAFTCYQEALLLAAMPVR